MAWSLHHFGRVIPLLRHLVVGTLAALLCAQAALSLKWRMEHDTPLLHYVAFLMDAHGRFPYRDIFETSMPGTFAFHYTVVKLFGYGDRAFRLVDLALLGALLGATYAFMRRFGRAAGLASAVAFGLLYLSKGQTMTLQRDYLGLLPVACALACLPRDFARPPGRRRFAAVGALFGASALLKPHLALGLPVVCASLLYFRRETRGRGPRDLFACAAACGVGLAAPLLLAALWLYANSALADFLSIFFNYLPLHVALTGAQQELHGFDHAFYLFEQTLRLGGYGPLFLCALFAAYHFAAGAGRTRETAASYAMLAACAAVYLVYPTLAGKFWDYHFMPTAYFLTLAAAICFFAPRAEARDEGAPALRALLAVVVFAAALCLQLNLPRYSLDILERLEPGYTPLSPKAGRVDAIARELRARAGPSDTVQPLDWAHGAIHAMLLARAPLATEFLYDYHFYHHTSAPFVRGLRQDFLAQLRQAAPRFIVETRGDKPWLRSPEAPGGFPELQRHLDADYHIVAEGNGYVIHERNAAANPSR
jgi:4-amino-4-deoxy-L-arabinose transferase-like glycosyltransferase